MSDIIGYHATIENGEPRPLFDAIYSELMSLHEGTQELDVVLALNIDDEDDGDSEFIEWTVVDYRVMRADHDYFLADDETLDLDSPNGLSLYAQLIDNWAHGVEGSNGYVLIHTHPDGYARPSVKDKALVDALRSVDFARDEERPRFYFMAIIDHTASWPIPGGDGEILPTKIREIDLAINDRFVREAIERRGEDHPMVDLLRRTREAMEAYFDLGPDDVEGMVAFTTMMQELKRETIPYLIEDLLKQQLGEYGVELAGFDMGMAQIDPETGRIDLSSIQGNPNLIPPQKKPSILDLPELGGPDGPEIRWN